MSYFIAEVSSNHSQDIGRCLKLIEAAKKSGFDAIKFQAFKVEELFSKEILRKSPEHLERKSGNSQLNFYLRLEQM